MDTDTVVFMVLVDGEYIQTEAKRSSTVARLLVSMQTSDQHPQLKHLKSAQCKFYRVKNPFEVSQGRSPSDSEDWSKYEEVGKNKTVKNLSLSQIFTETHLYLVIEDTRTLKAAKRDHPELYRCLQVEVGEFRRWTMDDIQSNGGTFENIPVEILDLVNKLQGRRSYNIDDDRGLSSAKVYLNYFQTSYFYDAQVPPAVRSPHEFHSFYNMHFDYLEQASTHRASTSSSNKADALKTHFLEPPFNRRSSATNLIYYVQMPWKFPMFISCTKAGDIPKKYNPTPDCSVWIRQFQLPLLITEVVSESNEQDRYRMLLQAIVLARLVFHLRLTTDTPSPHPFIVAIYLTANLIAERYIVMKLDSTTTKVHIAQKNFNLTDADDATAFHREMYNLVSELESFAQQLDASNFSNILAFKNLTSNIMSLHSSGARSSTRNTSTTTMDAINEGEEGPQDEESLGVFEDDHLKTHLRQLDCKVAYVPFQHPNIAVIENLTDGSLAGCLKFVKDGGKEIEIHQYLASLDFESNHTARLNHTWSVAGGTIIAMEAAGGRITKLKNKDMYLWPIMIQLFEAVNFMHTHGVAHMDIKPMNLLVHPDYGLLTVIDFGVSRRVKTSGQLFQSEQPVGTVGYIAPEVGSMKFSPILADLWSTGKVVEEFCLLCRPSPAREWLLSLSKQLLDDDPNKRPMMSEVSQRMLNYIAAENSGYDYILYSSTGVPSNPFPMEENLSSRVAATNAPMQTAENWKIELDSEHWPWSLGESVKIESGQNEHEQLIGHRYGSGTSDTSSHQDKLMDDVNASDTLGTPSRKALPLYICASRPGQPPHYQCVFFPPCTFSSQSSFRMERHLKRKDHLGKHVLKDMPPGSAKEPLQTLYPDALKSVLARLEMENYQIKLRF